MMSNTVVGSPTLRPSLSVAAAPSLDSTSTALLIASMHPHPDAGVSSPGSPRTPSPSRSPYRPGPTRMRSPATVVGNPTAAVIDRHGAVLVPHNGPSTPSFAT